MSTAAPHRFKGFYENEYQKEKGRGQALCEAGPEKAWTLVFGVTGKAQQLAHAERARKPAIESQSLTAKSPEEAAEWIRERVRVASLEIQVAGLAPARLAQLEEQVGLHKQEIDRLNDLLRDSPQSDIFRIVQLHEAVQSFTEILFGSRAKIYQESDPETSCEYFVVRVDCAGEVDEIVELHDRWHTKIRQVAGDLARHYRLSLDIK